MGGERLRQRPVHSPRGLRGIREGTRRVRRTRLAPLQKPAEETGRRHPLRAREARGHPRAKTRGGVTRRRRERRRSAR